MAIVSWPTWKEDIKNKNIKAICEKRFGFTPTPKQEEIIRVIAYKERRRTAINCMTRYGKTQCVAIGAALYVSFNPAKKVYLISATDEQAGRLRHYLAELFTKDPILQQLLEPADRKNAAERLRREMSKRRVTLIDGTEIITISAQGEAKRLMGHGGDLIIEDEACLIKAETYRTKISRMLGDRPDSLLVEISNPSDPSSHFFEHWNDPSWHHIHVSYEDALTEGRIDPVFLEEQRRELLPTEFQMLYESRFPDQPVDALYNLAAVHASMQQDLNPEAKDVIISCDVAEKGLDETVIFKAITDGFYYKIVKLEHYAKKTTTEVANRLLALQQEEPIATRIHIDNIGYGAGVYDIVKRNVPNPRTCIVIGCHFGTSPNNKQRFLNKKAEEYFRNAAIVNEGRVQLPKEPKLVRDCMGIKFEHNLSQRLKIVDPEKSPDYSDALVYLTWTPTVTQYGIAFG